MAFISIMVGVSRACISEVLAVIIVALVASTLLFSMMLPSGGSRASSRITQAEMKDIDQLCREANAMAKHNKFLRNAVLSL
jgi:hypothetical protein